MARLFTNGFEFNNMTPGMEYSNIQAGASTIDATIKRSGGYSLKIPSLTSGAATGCNYQYAASANSNDTYARFYIYITSYPNVINTIAKFEAVSFSTAKGSIRLTTTGTLQLWDTVSAAQFGSDSSVLSLNTWYQVELRANNTTPIYDARLNGVSFATGAVGQGTINIFEIGGNLALETCTTGVWYFDDIAVNDTTGTSQTSWAGAGNVIRLKPRAAGDSNQFSVQVGGSVGSANNFTRVNEVTPDEASSYNGDVTLNDSDMFLMDASGIDPTSQVTLVEVWTRQRDITADATTAIKAQIEKTSGGSIVQGLAIIPNSTSFRNNSSSPPRTPLVTYADPNGAAWTQATLDTMQCGYQLTAAGVNAIDVTSVSAIVEYTPASTTGVAFKTLLGVGNI